MNIFDSFHPDFLSSIGESNSPLFDNEGWGDFRSMTLSRRAISYMEYRNQIPKNSPLMIGEPYPIKRGAHQWKLSLGQLSEFRKTTREQSAQTLNFKKLSAVLELLSAVSADGHRSYASGGGMYCVEIGIFNFKLPELPVGAFNYDFKHRTLWKLSDRTIDRSTDLIDSYSLNRNCSAILCFFVNPTEVLKKYGENGWKFSLIELGSIYQLIYQASAELQLAICPQGRANANAIRDCLGRSQEIAKYAGLICIS